MIKCKLFRILVQFRPVMVRRWAPVLDPGPGEIGQPEAAGVSPVFTEKNKKAPILSIDIST